MLGYVRLGSIDWTKWNWTFKEKQMATDELNFSFSFFYIEQIRMARILAGSTACWTTAAAVRSTRREPRATCSATSTSTADGTDSPSTTSEHRPPQSVPSSFFFFLQPHETLPPPPPTFVFAHWLLDVPKRKEPIVIGCFLEILFYDKLGERFPKLSNPFKFMETSNQRRRSLFIFIFSFHIFIEFSFSLSLSLCSFSINIFSILSKIFFREREREVEIWTKAGTERMFRLSFLFFDKGGRIGSLFFYFLPFFSFSFLPATYLRPPRSFGTMGSCVD